MVGYWKNIASFQLRFNEEFMFFIAKSYKMLSWMESPWLLKLAMWKDPKIHFPTQNKLVGEHP